MIRTASSRLAPAAAFALLATPLAAADTQVAVTASSTYVPQHVTILVGDNVVWTLKGGFHNVLADDGSFRCADGCDQTGGNGNPSSSWTTASFQFTAPGFDPYHCEVHGFNMNGSVKTLRAIFADGFEDGGSAPEEWVPIVAVGDTCANPINVGGGWNTQDQLAGANNDLDLTASPTCGNQAAHGRDRVYQVDTLGEDVSVTVTPAGPGFDPFLYVLNGIGGCPTSAPLTCTETANAGGPGAAESLNFTTPGAPATYWVVVDTLAADTAGSDYTISISLVP